MYSTVCTGVQNDCFDPSRVIEGRAPLEAGELRPPAGRDRWTDDGYRVIENSLPDQVVVRRETVTNKKVCDLRRPRPPPQFP